MTPFQHEWATYQLFAVGNEPNGRRHGAMQSCRGILFHPACDRWCSTRTWQGSATLPLHVRSHVGWSHPFASRGSQILPFCSILRQHTRTTPSYNVIHAFNPSFALHIRDAAVPTPRDVVVDFDVAMDAALSPRRLLLVGCIGCNGKTRMCFIPLGFGLEWVLFPCLFLVHSTCRTCTTCVTSTTTRVRLWRQRRRMSWTQSRHASTPCAVVQADGCCVEGSRDTSRTHPMERRRWTRSDVANPSRGAKLHVCSPKDAWNVRVDGIGTLGIGSFRCFRLP